MADPSLFQQYKEVIQKDITFSYEGSMSQDVIVCLANSLELGLLCDPSYSKFLKKIFSVFIELTQNMTKYSANRTQVDNSGKKVGTGIILLKKHETHYSISSGNLVLHKQAQQVDEMCRHINTLDDTALKERYKEQMKKPSENRNGGGLGLIDMARKSKLPLRCEVNPVDDQYSYLIISVDIQKEN